MIIGGAQENTIYTIKGHLEHGHRVTLVTGPTDGPEGKLLQRFCPDGLDVVEMPCLIRNLNPCKDLKALRELTRYFRENHFDVVHTHASKAGIVGRIAATRAGVPFVCHTVHGQAFHQYQSWLKNFIYIKAEHLAARNCDRIFAVAQAMVDQCVEAGVAPREMYRVVYSGMELESFVQARRSEALRAELGIPSDALVVGTVARLFELKGHDCLIKAAPAIVKKFPDVRFLLVGDGVLRQKFEADIAAAGLQRNFVFAGLVQPERIPDYIAQMDIIAHLSLREGLPRACVQALAAGLPVVAHPLDGTPEVVLDGQTGLMAPPADADKVADAIVTLLGDADLRRRMGQAGQELVLKQFDWRHMADVLEKEYLDGVAKAEGIAGL